MTEHPKTLLKLAARRANLSERRVVSALKALSWEESRSPGDWQSYVPVEIRRLWASLTIEARAVAFVMALDRTDFDAIDDCRA